MAKLIIHHGTPQARAFELKPGLNSFGRGEANDCQITDGSVSTNHAEITVDGNSVRIKDLGSTNGTFINQSPVSESVLQPGQPLRLGAVNLLLQTDAPPLAPPPPIPINLASHATSVPGAPAPIRATGGGLENIRHAPGGTGAATPVAI